MRKLKKIGWIILVVLGVLILAGGIFMNSLAPTYEGEQEFPKLSDEVHIYYDTYGIPHIYAENEKDAFRALGYVHAQDRLWQMELLRRIGRGGLSEVFGKDLLGTDKFFLSLGIDEASIETVAGLHADEPMVQLSQAYLDGINTFISEGPTPIEFYLTGIDKTPFTFKDIYNTIGYMGFSFAQAHKTDPLLTHIKDKLGMTYLADLQIDANSNTTWIKNYPGQEGDTIKNTITDMVFNALRDLPVPLFEGSNSWVVGPKKTKNGKVILANDPHIGFAQPSVWYEAHISTPTYEKYGYHLAGVPFPLLGHDRNLAYGLTMFQNDDVDFYYEETHPRDSTKYRNGKAWEKYKIISKTILVKDGADVPFTYRKTRRGAVINGIADQVNGERPVSMSWIYTKVDNKLVEAVYTMSHANNLNDFTAALPLIHAPGLNVMYGDADGNIGWWASAKLYKMPDSTHTKFIMDGGSGIEEPIAYLDFSKNPKAINPPWNYVYSANNQPDSISGILYPGYYLPENRAKRIVDLLEPKDDWDKESIGEMILDVTSSTNPSIVRNLAKFIKVKELTDMQIKELDKLSLWKGDYPLNSVEAAVYHRWVYFFLKNTFMDELGEDTFRQLMATHLLKRIIAPLSHKKQSPWWDNVRTADIKESKQDIVHTSYMQALESLEKDFGKDMTKWTWDKLHTLEHNHPIGQVAALRSFFNVGPFPVKGSREVINNLAFPYDESGFYKVTAGPSTRRVIDFSDIENSLSILPTGQSGNPFSQYYEDQAEMFVQGKFRKMMLNKEEIIQTSNSVLTFKPKEK
ncbi:MAG: penicillin acylase family protein [Bacteroidota bacterium]